MFPRHADEFWYWAKKLYHIIWPDYYNLSCYSFISTRKRKEEFDAVLLDAPCSSEQHILSSPKHMAEWRPNRSKKLSMDQFTLICSAFDSLKSGGHLLYSTCFNSRLSSWTASNVTFDFNATQWCLLAPRYWSSNQRRQENRRCQTVAKSGTRPVYQNSNDTVK